MADGEPSARFAATTPGLHHGFPDRPFVDRSPAADFPFCGERTVARLPQRPFERSARGRAEVKMQEDFQQGREHFWKSSRTTSRSVIASLRSSATPRSSDVIAREWPLSG